MSAPLVVETLEQRLHRLIPGAVVVDAGQRYRELGHQLACASNVVRAEKDCDCDTRQHQPEKGHEFIVVRDDRVLASGPSEREAVGRALFLYGGGR